MLKKILPLVIILGLAGAAFFYWQNNQADVKELNKTLPEGVKVAKSLIGDEYKIVNKIDDYEFKIPSEWQGVKEVEYIPERVVEKMLITSIGLEGVIGYGRILSIDAYALFQVEVDLEQWAKELLNTFDLGGVLEEEKIGNSTVIKIKEEEHLAGTYIYFLKNDSIVYVFNCGSEEFIRYIITNGKW